MVLVAEIVVGTYGNSLTRFKFKLNVGSDSVKDYKVKFLLKTVN